MTGSDRSISSRPPATTWWLGSRRPGPEGRVGVLVGTDGSVDSAVAVERAATEALHLHQDLTVVQVCDGDDASSDIT